MIVVDASSWVVGLVDAGPAGDAAREVLSADPDWTAPTHAPLEVLRTLRRYEHAGTLPPASAASFAAEVVQADVRYPGHDPGLLHYVWTHRHSISPYDAPYVGLAERYGITLVTNDVRLARGAAARGVAVTVPVPPSS